MSSTLRHLPALVISFSLLTACTRESRIVDEASGAKVARQRVAAPAGEVAKTALAGLSAPAATPPQVAAFAPRAMDSVSRSMIIRTGQVEITVDSLAPAIAVVERLAWSIGGFVAGSSIQAGQGQQHQAILQIRLPSTRFQQALSGLSGVGKLVSSTTNSEDVGEEFVDVTARVSNAHRLEERLVTLLATRTGKLEDALAVERELARVREEIERYEGRLRYLRSQVAVSTLTVTLSEPAPIVGRPGSNVIVEALKQAWRNCVTAVAGGIVLLGGLLPLLAVVGTLGLAWRKWGTKKGAPIRL